MKRLGGRLFDALPQPLARAVFGLIQRGLSLEAPDSESDDGLPLPPRYLRVLTAGSAHPEAFQVLGRNAAEEFIRLAAEHGQPLSDAAVLEFGVGCGRVARHVTRLRPSAAFHGCDVDRRLLEWAANNLPGRYAVTRHDPPLPYADGAFDFIYALSVFTHLHDANCRSWLSELARTARPGGLAILSYHDEHLPQAADLRSLLLKDGFAILREGAEGSNLLSTYLTAEGFSDRAAPNWTLLQTVPSHATANGQALAVFRRT